ncbi:FG-GAP repeat protein [Streptomyces sp. YIM 130001]|uniref:FG-GAP and VCBS repeat-containing protein n=1 Tax=Streptomyces sp. YIM 130001 TaxID=2259644 RepID=UPI000E65D974|nr:FG-GAP and VCBS repeat-containing protein [Streptomyces sp. YIM 130001]RII20331.1 FG-GAP repeat protein [Streptomyces sp. YIM 130001]
MRISIKRLGVTAAAGAVCATLPLGWMAFGSSADADCGDRSPAKAAASPPKVDFDGDGNDDVVTRSPQSEVAGEDGAGYVSVVYGSQDGPDPERHQVLSQKDADTPGSVASNAGFGTGAVARDFDADGLTDLAVAVSRYGTSSGRSDPGAPGGIIVFFGSKDGLKQSALVEHDGRFDGELFRGGDFDGDGNADLVWGVGEEKGLLKGPFTRSGSPAGTGAVPSGTHQANWDEDMIVGDLTGDGADDLVVPQSHGKATEEPALVIRGGGKSLTAVRQGRLPFGRVGAIADFNGDGYGDLVVERQPLGKVNRPSSTIEVVFGSKSGLSNRYSVIDQDTEGVPGKRKAKDNTFGSAMDAGDLNGDGYADLAVGNMGQETAGKYHSGAVTVLNGGPCGVTGRGAERIALDTAGVPGAPTEMREFGTSVKLLDADGDNRLDLAAGGAGYERGVDNVWVVPGSGKGLKPKDTSAYGPKDLSGTDISGNTIDFSEGFPR